jgi:predicted GNAT family N-acyltransferase
MLFINKISQDYEMDAAMSIRNNVFVSEQHVPKEMEHDEHDATSHHYLAIDNGIPCGTARWRETSVGVKLERFAVLKNYRGQGIGAALVEVVLMDVRKTIASGSGKKIYLHSQVNVMPFYEKFGFKKTGPVFDECGIEHYMMILVESLLRNGQ